MGKDEMEELLRLTRENNEMLKELTAYVRKIDSSEYRDASDFKEFSMNIIADILVEVMEEPRKRQLHQDVRNAFNIKK